MSWAKCLSKNEMMMLFNKRKCVVSISFILATFLFISKVYSKVHTWQRWEQSLVAGKNYANPYADVTLSVTYSGPGGRTIKTFGFWDGESTFTVRCAFPVPRTWNTTCSDTADTGFHIKAGRYR